ncbi:import inner membrane translocase subunit tim50 [Delitschia confertaspora ATCC 74209]|uniref:Mitochondrial import inner membrane translocase subunit TIM50 n=1 Tax=Delitschia confertaspora ATCC 74209 TaxID=1513339 RepID=A0A9P4JKG0_9PLEO|nr:import inner membrane translocase subunit tim50 [Delitschia confertaspora ATCC 74209]
MLPRAASRALRVRAAPTPFFKASPLASTSQWPRSYAKVGKPKPPHSSLNPAKKPSTSNANAAAAASKSTPVHPKEQPEFDQASTPERNTEPTSTGESIGTSKAAGVQSQKEYYNSQEEFSGPQTPKENTAPTTEDAGEAPASNKPLPDLRQGIPSTFAAEFLKNEEAKHDAKAHHPINITEDPDKEPSSTHGGAGGREGGAGELPKSAYETSVDRRRNRVANWGYIAALLFGTVGTVYLGRNWESEEEEKAHPEAPSGWSAKLMYDRAKARLNSQMGYYTEPTFPKLLPDMDPAPPYTLVISLEDMLVHSEWTREKGWRLAKRPGVDYFLRYLSQYYELVIFTSQRSQDADPIIRKLDPFRVVMWPLFREASRYEKGEYIKDLSYLNRDLSKTIIIDTDPSHVKLQPENAIILPKWKGTPGDKDLVALIPFLEYIATMGVNDVRTAIKSFEGKHIPTEFALREAKAREAFHKQLAEEEARKPKRSAGGAFMKALGLKEQSQGMVPGEMSAAEAYKQGKMLSDQIRERGMKQYEAMEKEIRENGEKWLKEMAEEEKRFQEEQMKSMKSGVFGFFGSKKE